jgi:hypothetical protein
MLKFEWDEAKALANAIKHGVTFHEAASVFGDPLAYCFNDPDHSVGEAAAHLWCVARRPPPGRRPCGTRPEYPHHRRSRRYAKRKEDL